MNPGTLFEVNFDGIVGPTHHYAGLSYGNLASMTHRGRIANPRKAALQGLRKMKLLHDLGIRQAVLPPHERPDIRFLKRLGFHGTDSDILRKAAGEAPDLLAACSSASSMWAANAGTFTPAIDAADEKAHFTPANLCAELHRSIESETTARVFKAIFRDESHFVLHPPLPATSALGDEGAANHTRFCDPDGNGGVHLFVFGRRASHPGEGGPRRFPPRQTFEASAAVARSHRLDPDRVVFARQNPEAIDRGVFHNDVVSVGHRNVFLFHELAFDDPSRVLRDLAERFSRAASGSITLIQVSDKRLTLEDAVSSYLFNSQLVSPHGEPGMILIAPEDCRGIPAAERLLEDLRTDPGNPIRRIQFVDLRQSMENGGGPACLRLRIVMSDAERLRSNPSVYLDDGLYGKLVGWVEKHYRDRLSFDDLSDPNLLRESRTALDELSELLDLGSIYPFQRNE
jgi:succinylarginine dihydrolase